MEKSTEILLEKLNKKITFNILGSCVIRDIFRLNNDEEFIINRYVNEYCPLYLHENGIDINKDEFNNVILNYEGNKSNFRLMCKYIDLNHSSLEYIKEK